MISLPGGREACLHYRCHGYDWTSLTSNLS